MGQPIVIVIILLVVPTAVPINTSIPPGPPSARYLHPNTIRDRLNHTLNSLAIGPELVQSIATATTPLRMQLFTPIAPQLPVASIP